MNNSVKWIWMQKQFGIGTRRAHEALLKYHTPDNLLSLTETEIKEDTFLNDFQKGNILRRNFDTSMRIIIDATQKNIGVLTIEDDDYPERLKSIYSPPFVLFYKGDIKLLNQDYHITMVGTRNPNLYGIEAGCTIAHDLASAGVVVVSGLAVGIDITCHRAALDAKGKTIGVAVCGLDIDYPPTNRIIRNEIEQSSLVISEFAPKTPVESFNFKIRNRILSGLSQGTIIVECKRKSGTMLTASHALAQNRDLFAVPGNIFDPLSEGTNSLLLEGAEPAISAEQIMSRYIEIYGKELGFTKAQTDIKDKKEPNKENKMGRGTKKRIPPDYLDEKQLLVFNVLLEGNANIDILVDKTDLESFEVLSVLTQLEISAIINAVPGGMYQLI